MKVKSTISKEIEIVLTSGKRITCSGKSGSMFGDGLGSFFFDVKDIPEIIDALHTIEIELDKFEEKLSKL